jgi:adenylate cyclase
MLDREAKVPEAERIQYRVGINLGDIVIDGEDILGDGVNIAARLEGLAEPGGICISRPVHTQTKGKLDLTFEHLGEKKVKNLPEPVTVYRVVIDAKAAAFVTPLASVKAAQKRARRWPVVVSGLTVLALVLAGALYWKLQAPALPTADPEKMAFPLPDKPSIAVLPLVNIGGDPEQEYFADGITNDLITDLSKFNELFVIAANSTFTYKGKPVKVQEVAEDLGVRYVLEGSVQRAGDTIRVNVQLVDALSGHHLWAERYDRQVDDLFVVQSEIIKTIIGSLQLQVRVAEIERTLKRPTDSLSAYDYFLRGFAQFLIFNRESNARAKSLQEKAIELDPSYARAHANLARVHRNNWRYDWADDTSESMTLALEHARRAVELDPDDYWSPWVLGQIYLEVGEPEKALAGYERALALNPHDPALLMEMVELLVSLGDAEQAVAQAKTAMRYNPHHPDWYLWNLGWSQYFAGQHEEAVATLQKMTEPPNGVRRTLAAALVQVGRLDEAREMINEFRRNEPEQTVSDIRKLPYKHRPFIEKWANDLLKAGLPE